MLVPASRQRRRQGYSWGALAAARIAIGCPRVKRLILVSPPAAMLDGPALAAAGKSLFVLAGDRDEYVPIDPLRALLEGVERSELVVLEGVDHFFMEGLAEVGRAARHWLDSSTSG